MVPFVSKYVEECTTYNRVKALRQPRAPPDPLPVPPYPWHTVGLDFVTNLPMVKGYDSVLVTVDHLTRMAHFTPCRCDITSKQTAELFVKEVIRLHGVPQVLVSDRDPCLRRISGPRFGSCSGLNLICRRLVNRKRMVCRKGLTKLCNSCYVAMLVKRTING